MPSFRKRKSALDEEPVVALTSRQLILGICLFLIWTLLAFMTGSVVARYELSGTKQEARVQTGTQDAPGTAGSSGTPRKVVEVPAPAPATPPPPSTAPVSTKPYKEVVMPPQPGQKPKEAVEAVPKMPTPKARGVPSAQPAGTDAAPKKTEAPPGEVREAKAESPPTPPQKPPAKELARPAVPQPEPVLAGAAPAGPYGIQVASFRTAQRQQAEECQRLLESNSGLKADLVTSQDGQWVRVIVGSYLDRESAETARQELRKKAGFSECFVQKR